MQRAGTEPEKEIILSAQTFFQPYFPPPPPPHGPFVFTGIDIDLLCSFKSITCSDISLAGAIRRSVYLYREGGSRGGSYIHSQPQ